MDNYMKKYNDDDIKNMIDKVKKGNKNALKNMDDLIFCNITKNPWFAKNIKKFNVPMLSFFNYKSDSTHKIGKKINETKINDIEHIRKNNSDKETESTNKTHELKAQVQSEEIISVLNLVYPNAQVEIKKIEVIRLYLFQQAILVPA